MNRVNRVGHAVKMLALDGFQIELVILGIPWWQRGEEPEAFTKNVEDPRFTYMMYICVDTHTHRER